MEDKEQSQIVEAILFATPTPIPPLKLAEILGLEGTATVKHIIHEINSFYQESARTFRIQEVAGGYQMRTLPEYRPWIQKLDPLKPIKLSLPTIETLAIVAYKQPITKSSVEFIRGVDSSYTLRTLMQKKMVKVVGKEMLPGRPILYGTTKFFLEVFGLKEIAHLPTLKDLEMPKSATEEDTSDALGQLK